MAFLGYHDLTYNNLYFTKEGKVAIIDTEPQKRFLNKLVGQNFVRSFFVDIPSLRTQQALAGTAKLKDFCTEETQKEIEKVEKTRP